ncbi:MULTISPECIES: TIGR03757 family integrating conjugative element protein [Pseudomonas]|uniref:TIGR03757 family integrating conjugative element protein n=1 Tax=Pseudomonas TaxID=286 RepID=UPI0024830B59|nr:MULTISPECIES: TIGR03757 family integrating conjugative element protein [Pseudomonas]
MCLFLSAGCFGETLVFTDSIHPVSNTGGAKVSLLDAPQHIESELSQGLPAEPERAAEMVQARMQSAAGHQLIERMRLAQQGVADAWSLRVEKLPAVVVDRTYVVYGIADVAQAEALIAAQRKVGEP